MVRSGGCIFGTVRSNFFKNVVELYARVLQIRIVNEEHNNFGYNGTFQSKEKNNCYNWSRLCRWLSKNAK